ncbi:MAG: glycosyltransferase [Melioribacteraceae bacterium]|nr:glycosyltransferase [Melioribacteraceae bacterium]MCF8354041.1 glycosyltransferase [Melioribacteraceae bacterium]MCF8392278.1 glycosyltransferase [Melioribacteraceae bacterium]MCF8417610.1 glycosyltransferase [Melioribacteraceae bacterium]
MNLYKDFTPVVSVVMPTFNREWSLHRAIQSVIKQTFSEWELIIVDDGSTDSTFEMINQYINSFENIRYMKHSNRKPPLTHNAGIQASTGKYITFLGSDDEFKPEHLELRIKFLDENDSIDLLHGGVEIIGDPFVKDKNDLTKKIHLKDCTIGGTFFGRREVFFALGGFRNLKYSDDSDFYERASSRFKILQVDKPTYIYHRDSPDSICDNIE